MENKTLKNRIFKYNVFLTLLPIGIIVLLLIGGFFYIKNIIEKETINENTMIITQHFDDINETSFSLEETGNLVESLGFTFYVSKNGQPLVELRPTELPDLETIVPSYDTHVILKFGFTYISRKVVVGSDSYFMVAGAYSDPVSFINPRTLFTIFMYIFVVFYIVILLLIADLTRRLSKSIEDPISMLIAASNRVKQGDLDKKLNYEEQEYYEFIEVCDAFNEMTEQLQNNIEKATRLEQTRTTFIAGISHDLKTPLTSIKGYSKGLLDGVANTKEKQEKYLKIIYDKACHMEKLFDQLVLVSDLETNTVQMNAKKENVKSYMDNFVDKLKLETEFNNVVINYKNTCNDEYFKVDDIQFNRVLMNIVNNSIKYVDNKKLELDISVLSVDDKIKVIIKDNGNGVPEDKIEKIFDLLFRLDEARSSSKEGSGLGLAIAKQIIERLNGSISASNDSGLKITIELIKVV